MSLTIDMPKELSHLETPTDIVYNTNMYWIVEGVLAGAAGDPKSPPCYIPEWGREWWEIGWEHGSMSAMYKRASIYCNGWDDSLGPYVLVHSAWDYNCWSCGTPKEVARYRYRKQ